jgi:hypothetical protein
MLRHWVADDTFRSSKINMCPYSSLRYTGTHSAMLHAVLYRAFQNFLRNYKHLYQENQRTYINGIESIALRHVYTGPPG